MDSDANENCVDKPPTLNVKCIVFTLILAAGYWYLPPRNKWVLLGLLYFPYAAMAWYDYYYKCERNLGPTYLALFYWWLKPYASDQIQTYAEWCPRWKRRVFIADIVVLICALLLAWPFLKWRPSRK